MSPFVSVALVTVIFFAAGAAFFAPMRCKTSRNTSARTSINTLQMTTRTALGRGGSAGPLSWRSEPTAARRFMSAGNRNLLLQPPELRLHANALPHEPLGIPTATDAIIECRLGTSEDQPQWAVR